MGDEPRSIEELLKERARLDGEIERFQRLVTVMFTDIAGSTRYFDQHGDLAGMAMLTRVNDCLQPLVGRHQGTIVKTIGDAIMAYFENPVEAVRCAIAMQRAMVALNRAGKDGEEIRIRVALNLGVGLLKGKDIFGDVVNVCSRIEHETQASQIGVSPSVVEAISQGKEFACRKIGSVALRGKSKALDLYEIIWAQGETAPLPPPARMSAEQLSMATGTDLKMQENVRAAIAAALRGQPAAHLAPADRRFVLVEDPPGGPLGRRFVLRKGGTVVGRANADILFSHDPLLAAQHAVFSTPGGSLYVEDLGSPGGTFVRLRDRDMLQDGDTVLLARLKFLFRARPGAEAPQAELVRVEDDGREGQRFPLPRGETTFGRSQATYTFPDDPYLSRRHARITVQAKGCELADLNSTNGTFLRIRGRHLLDADDQVLVGSQCLRVLVDQVPAGSRAPEPAPAEAGPGLPVVGVLDFENLSRDAEMDWLGTGVAETLTADLKQLKQLRVLSRERIQQASQGVAGEGGLEELGRQLGARWLVAGGYQRSSQKLRLTSRVLDVGSGEVAATAKVDGDWEDLFSLQDRLVAELAAALEIKMDSSEQARIRSPETRQLDAYECYAQGRKNFYQLGKDSLEEARQHFERALQLDPNYALAHSGLGSTYAMRFVHRTDPEDLKRARRELERALALDPELGEPFPWLCYMYGRMGKLKEALEAGRAGVRHQSDLAYAHYFLAVACLVNAESDPDTFYQEAVEGFLRCLTVDPRHGPAYICLGWITIIAGAYDQAERFLSQGHDLEKSGTSTLRFVGAEMMLGDVWLRRGDLDKARQVLQAALVSLGASDHMYREPCLVMTACSLGDLELRRPHPQGEAALAEYRRAWRTLQEFPRMLGHERALTRTLAGLAAAHAAAGDRERAAKHAEEAAAHLERVASTPQSIIFQALTPHLHYALAAARLLLVGPKPALDSLEQAVATGWRDPHWPAADPIFVALRAHPRFRALVKRLEVAPRLNFATVPEAAVL